ncbi:LPP20 family lipoprotein [Motilimonas cestriensis]|uniref:LPP20 family lipoprotein n=1 Tax=Motilimonas cestriensis TaxID=2742685 RepID=A0ABS8W9C8_9GAMM|nr:LPP20 family lipoprotein [Motilimonas cestriensis]MCE2595619.1 LPP20 family lipoprotein [Motilimonas cestriensis]
MFKTSLIAAALLLSGCSQVANTHIEYETVKPDKFPTLIAVGYAPIDLQPGATKQQKMLNAIRASKLDAYRELAEQVYGLQISSQNSLNTYVIGSDKVKARVDGLIKGARVVQSYPMGEVYATELELDTEQLYYINEMQSMPKKVKKITYY